jgi:hypothetical protein
MKSGNVSDAECVVLVGSLKFNNVINLQCADTRGATTAARATRKAFIATDLPGVLVRAVLLQCCRAAVFIAGAMLCESPLLLVIEGKA